MSVAKIQMLDVKSQVESAVGLWHAKITDATKSSGYESSKAGSRGAAPMEIRRY